MANRPGSHPIRVESFQTHPTLNQLLVALGVLVGLVVGAFIAGPGFGVMVLTLVVIGSALWISYGTTSPVQAVSASPGAAHIEERPSIDTTQEGASDTKRGAQRIKEWAPQSPPESGRESSGARCNG